MQTRFIGSGPSGSTPRTLPSHGANRAQSPYPLLRLPTALPAGLSNIAKPDTSNSLAIIEAVPRLTSLSLDPPPFGPGGALPSLIRGFKATIPSSEIPKQRRRMIRGGLVDADLGGKIGLKKLGDRARGLLTDGDMAGHDENELEMGRRSRRRRKARESRRNHPDGGGRGGIESKLHLEDLVKQADEIAQDKENLSVRTVRPNSYTQHPPRFTVC